MKKKSQTCSTGHGTGMSMPRFPRERRRQRGCRILLSTTERLAFKLSRLSAEKREKHKQAREQAARDAAKRAAELRAADRIAGGSRQGFFSTIRRVVTRVLRGA